MGSAIRKVAVLMGGMSLEHEVSLRSGAGVTAALRRRGHEVMPVTLTKDGSWVFDTVAAAGFDGAVSRLAALRPDCVFIALHGGPGEDGRVQGLLDLMGLPYTTTGSAASGLCMDKVRAKAVAGAAGVPVARELTLTQSEWAADPAGVLSRIENEIGLPCVIKAPCHGSSCGMAITRDAARLSGDLDAVMPVEGRVMVEEYLRGVEVTCAVLDTAPGAPPRALPLTEICPVTADFFDYTAKYTPGATEEITPARLDPETTARAQSLAVLAHRRLGCRIWSRSDFIVTGGRGPVWLEVNTVPGLTETSLFPQAAAAVGIGYDELMELFVNAAIDAARR
ncbi:MAG: D-alanine--D-alanine ligase [Candidatus Hydrogenedentes bacterium]|nr:D-alanine--D-alanine ligase [Candidatus Hydrogenedentota bacterium]